ncbi:GreA/GreB family elongation factor [Opitutus terrae]|uniref:GreA/GreB family elongation factor n=1 Tax=Opitutus terrae (strain DSM 11246 / JCM 15787 / PB90-1) TaxID=452637 RepID=B1ZQE9_OPITP|nr:GreA/GreB family elongation factor [Opitutus terrae]ACB73629.1 GreA/GreB family elongation factor [Opitutus terrae PB90-1]
MSKAFLRESDVEPEPTVVRPVLLAPGAKRYLTEAGAERLHEELNRLRTVERPALAGAAADLDAKRELRKLDERARELQQILATAEIISSPAPDRSIVRFGAKVTVKEEDGTTSTYRIVGIDETEFYTGGISFQSPLAQALLGASVGDRIQFQSPAGPRQLEIQLIE